MPGAKGLAVFGALLVLAFLAGTGPAPEHDSPAATLLALAFIGGLAYLLRRRERSR